MTQTAQALVERPARRQPIAFHEILAEPRYVEAPLSFLSHSAQAPVTDDSSGSVVRDGDYTEAVVQVHDARALVPAPTLDRQGFALVTPDFAPPADGDPEAIRAETYPLVERYLRRLTGATRVLVFDHNLRSGDQRRAEAEGLAPPVRMAHNDYTEASGPKRAREVLEDAGLPEAEIEHLLAGRVAQINLWRPLKPVRSAPLTLADARTVAAEELVPTKRVSKTRSGEIYYVAHGFGQLWYSFPDMDPDEALLIKGYDSAKDGRARFTPHSAYDDPRSPANAPPRESIELRTFAFFED